jgi:PAS domain S-box-containing protein
MDSGPPKKLSVLGASITVNQSPIQWNPNNQGFKFFGVESIIFWQKPSLIAMLQPLQEELGENLYSCLIAFESAKGTYEDYHAMVTTLGKTFEEGFLNWGAAVGVCGWGQFFIEKMDWEQKEAIVRIDNPWELNLFKFKDIRNQIPFLNGKISGLFTHAFGTNCRSEIKKIHRTTDGANSVYLEIKPSLRTLEQALNEVQSDDKHADRSRLLALNNALRRNERRFLDVIETVGDFLWETDRNLTITYATEKASKILHLNEALVGKKWFEFLDVKEFQKLQSITSKLTGPTSFVEAEFELRDKNGEPFWILLRIKELLDFSNNQQGFVGSGRDITQQKLLQMQVAEQQKNSEVAAKMATLGEMAGSVSHEINTPLAVISLLSEQLLANLELGTPEYKSAKTIFATTTKISKIIQGLKAFSRNAAQDPCVSTPLRLIIEDTLALGQTRFKNSGIQLYLPELSADLVLNCRATQLSQVLLNLLNNAFDAVSDLGEKWIRFEVSEENGQILIRLTDSGNGIEATIVHKIMNPFFTTKPSGVGTGLGLSISKDIVESHGGRLYYDSQVKNTSFVLSLPKPVS